MLQRFTRRSAVAAATVLAAASASLLVGGGAAHAAGATGEFLYTASTGPGTSGCQADLEFFRYPGGKNFADGIISTENDTPQWVQCIGALERSSNGGRSWTQVSATHSVWGNEEYPVTSGTDFYADGAAYLARTCIYAVDHYYGTTSRTVCTSAH